MGSGRRWFSSVHPVEVRMMLDGMSSTDYSAVTLSATQATSISSEIGGAETSGSADVDLYRVVLAAGDQITVSTQTPGDLDTHLRLFDEAGVELVSNNNTTDASGNYTTDSKLVFRALLPELLHRGLERQQHLLQRHGDWQWVWGRVLQRRVWLLWELWIRR